MTVYNVELSHITLIKINLVHQPEMLPVTIMFGPTHE